MKLTRSNLVAQIKNSAIDLARLAGDRGVSDRIKSATQRADRNGDGKVSGSREADRLFTELDRFDRDGSRNSLNRTPEIDALLGHAQPLPPGGRPDFMRGLLDLLGSAARPTPPSASAPAPPSTSSALPGGRTAGVARGTGYYPYNNRMEGGFLDKQDTKLNTLQDYLAGRADYVSIALDKNLYRSGQVKYGDRFRIPELEARHGREIEFRAVDTGGAFTNRGFGRVDICTGSRRDSLEPTVNGQLTLIKLD